MQQSLLISDLSIATVDSNESPFRRNFFLSRKWQQRQLNSGDYTFYTQDGSSVGIELKLMPDFISSLFERLPRQLHDMLQDYNISILMLVGPWEMSAGQFTSNGNVTNYTWGMVWNFLRTWQDRGITLELCHDELHACNRICEIRSYYAKAIHTGAFINRSSCSDPRIAALTACKGMGEKTAQSLLNKFSNLEGIVLAKENDIVETPGIGPKMAKRIYEFLH